MTPDEFAEFSPPYGDCTIIMKQYNYHMLFSPPYGDCTSTMRRWKIKYRLSPPYGDCTLNISQNTAKLKSRMARKYSLYYNDVLLR